MLDLLRVILLLGLFTLGFVLLTIEQYVWAGLIFVCIIAYGLAFVLSDFSGGPPKDEL